MLRKLSAIGLLGIATAGAAFAQNCPCVAGNNVTRLNQAAIVSRISQKMACAVVQDEQWQEFHKGTTAAGGDVVDFKKGTSDPVDPSETVGSYVVGTDTISYTYGSKTYEYAVCSQDTKTHFCGAAFGGRDITSVTVAGSSLQSCTGLAAPTAQ